MKEEVEGVVVEEGTEVEGPGSALSELVLLTNGTVPADGVNIFLALMGRLSIGVTPLATGPVPSNWIGMGLGRTFIPS